MERYDVGIWLNVLLIILECIALIQCLDALGCIDLTFYTIDSNIFLLISAVLYLISRKNIPYIVHLAKYSSTVSVLITFLVVLFALYPLSNFDFQFMFLSGPNLLMHVLCPIIALISFLSYFCKNTPTSQVGDELHCGGRVYYIIMGTGFFFLFFYACFEC